MSHVFPRHTKAPPPLALRGEGVYLYDADGKAYLDGSGGAAVSCLGHSDAEVIAAVRGQVGRLAFAHTGFFTSEPAEALADRLIAHAPEGIERVYFVSGGSEAVEAALKLARQYFIEVGQPQRRHFIARRQSYHGNTLGALATGGNEWRREPFAPLMIETSHIAPCYEYRGRQAGESAEDYGLRVADELEAELHRLGPDTVIAFVAEPVVGATAGAMPAVPGYFKRVREICDRHGILLILDEVMCGMGRTGSFFASEQEGISPDIVTIAKGLGAGYQPIGAMLCSGRIYDAIEGGSGFFQHGHTYIGHPTACAAADVVVTKLTDGGLTERARVMGDRLEAALKDAFGQHPHIGDIRGRGLFRGLEIVADRETKRPFAPERAVHKAVKKKAFENGLICYPMGGTIDGRLGDHVLLAPPFILEDAHIDELVGKLSATFDAVL
ncbi:aspartate aminotransferase family protein [Actibacterium sp. MT2.3-13A]|uniref:aspartate aminotransferase family protein n=1 Tax=Actibacterium sp. MT2.3-13A TaxID=2828332 RepID=UPI001BA4C986|nr:aspartate aminotransferase family protein [Actibacterium sp. MT2.3-13A]